MDGAVSGRGALKVIEAHFRFLIDEHAFALTQSADVPAMAWYSSGDRSVVVSYDVSSDVPLSVALEDGEGGTRYDLWRLAAMRDASADGPLTGPQSAETLAMGCERARGLLERFCEPYLRGEPEAFRRSSREAVLVEKTRELARSAYFDGDYKLAVRLFDALRDYWDDRDRETFELAKRGETPIARSVKR